MAERSLYLRLLSQVRADLAYLRWHSQSIGAQLIHMATNARAEGVIGRPAARGQVVAMDGAGNRSSQQRTDEAGNPKFRADPIIDVQGKPIVNSAGDAFDVVMPAFRTVALVGRHEDVQHVLTLAERAGQAVAGLPDLRQLSFARGWSFSTPRDLWWALLFEMAWTKEYPFLVAKRWLWLPAEHPGAFVPYNLDQLKALGKSQVGLGGNIPPNWLHRLPEAWVSEVDNVIWASMDAADCLLSETPSDSIPVSGNIPEDHPTGVPHAAPPVQIRRRFAVALSFPGEWRDFMAEVAHALERKFGQERVFYDKFHEVELAVPDLDLKLQRIYREDSDLVVVFVCREYSEKEWCGVEWRAIRDQMKDKAAWDTDVMFVRLDDKPLPGLLSIDGYLSVSGKSGDEIADAIVKRWTMTR